MAELSWWEEQGARGGTENVPIDTEDLGNSVHNWENPVNLADDFETWYAQKKAKAEGGQGGWTDAKMDEPDGPEVSYFDTLDQSQDLSVLVRDSIPSSEECYQFDIYYDFGKKHREPKIKTRKWKLSTPPALSNIGSKHQEKLTSRTAARKTIRSNFGLAWGDSAARWVDELVTEDDGQSLTIDSNKPFQADEFETSFSDMTWAEIQLTESDPSFKKYRTYQSSLLRWCCTATMD